MSKYSRRGLLLEHIEFRLLAMRTIKPTLLREASEIERIERALHRFYLERPSSYGLLERDDSALAAYAEVIDRYVDDKEGVVVDLGAGTWRSPEAIAARGFNTVVGLDLFPDWVIELYEEKRRFHNIRIEKYNGKELPFNNSTIRVVASLCVLEHVVKVDKLLDEIDRVLVPGGMIVIVCPNWSGPNNAVRAIQMRLTKGDRYWQYETLLDSLFGIVRSFIWYLQVLFAQSPKFLYIYPRMIGENICFERKEGVSTSKIQSEGRSYKRGTLFQHPFSIFGHHQPDHCQEAKCRSSARQSRKLNAEGTRFLNKPNTMETEIHKR